MASEKLRVGIIGANYTLIAHGGAWRALPGVEIGAICTARTRHGAIPARGSSAARTLLGCRESVVNGIRLAA